MDEFQDTDATQIRTFARLVHNIHANLFVVGDVKQSIYSFKGATDEAFDILDEEMRANYAQTECQFRYCGTAIPFLTVRSAAR